MTFGNGNCQHTESCRGSVHSKHIKKVNVNPNWNQVK